MGQNRAQRSVEEKILHWLNKDNIDEWLLQDEYSRKIDNPKYLDDIVDKLEKVGKKDLIIYLKCKWNA